METQQVTQNGWFGSQVKFFESSRYAVLPLLMLIQSCIGSIACMTIFHAQAGVAMLSVCVMVTMLCNTALIAQMSAKWCIGTFYLSVIINILLGVGALVMM